MRRRSLLNTGLSAGLLILSGCSTVPRKELTVSNSTYESVGGLSPPDTPVTSRQFRGIELGGQLQLDNQNPVCLVPIEPIDDSHYILEYNIAVRKPGYIADDDPELDVRLVPQTRIEALLNEAEDEQKCGGPFGCRDTNELETFDSELPFEPGVKVGENSKYKRIELCSDKYYLTFDSTELWHKAGNSSSTGPEVSPFTADVALRTFSTKLFDRQSMSFDRVSQFAQQFNRENNDTITAIEDLQSTAGSICELSHVQQVSDKTIDDITSAEFDIRAVSTAAAQISEYINENYRINLPMEYIKRMDSVIRFGASTLPIVGSIYMICTASCDLHDKKIPQNPSRSELMELKRVSRKLGKGLLFFVIDILLLWSGIGGKIAKTTVQVVDELILRYLSKYVGHDIYFKFLEWVYLMVDAEISLKDFIETKTREYAHPDEEQSILDRLDGIDEDGISGWRQIDGLLEESCQKVTANVSGGIPPLQSSQQL